MSDHACSDKLDMSCPLLEKLAPETRSIIYEYVLSFETPVKHATNLQPFLRKLTAKNNEEIPFKHATNFKAFFEKLTGGKIEPEPESAEVENESDGQSIEGEDDSGFESTEAEPESSLGTEAAGEPESLRRVNTSILTASKLIYTEAVAVFYKSNTISIDAQFCAYEALESPKTTDLSLATQVVTKVDLSKMSQNSRDGEFGAIEFNAIRIATVAIPSICPNLRSSTFFLYVNRKFLLHLAVMMRANPVYSETSFDGVGSIAACSTRNRKLKIVVQCRETMESWAEPTGDISPHVLHPLLVTAGSLYRHSRGDPQGFHAQYARTMFSAASRTGVPEGYGGIDYDSYEFWTVVDNALSAFQRALGAQMS